MKKELDYPAALRAYQIAEPRPMRPETASPAELLADFHPDHILTVRTADDHLHALFSIDYGCWFDDWAGGRPPGAGRRARAEAGKLLEGLAVRQLQLPKKEPKRNPIPFVEERSPALMSYEPPREFWIARLMSWLGILISLGVIAWLTWQGMARMKEHPRKEIPVWKAR